MASFEAALTALKSGKRVSLPHSGKWLYFNSGVGKLVIDSERWGYFLWEPSQFDLFRTDWVIEGEATK